MRTNSGGSVSSAVSGASVGSNRNRAGGDQAGEHSEHDYNGYTRGVRYQNKLTQMATNSANIQIENPIILILGN